MNTKIKALKRHIDKGDVLITIGNKVKSRSHSIKAKFVKDNEPPKKVAVIGWIGAYNLGDEMMLDVTLRHLRKVSADVTLITHKLDDSVKSRYEGYTIVPRRPLTNEALALVVRNNDALFVNGGALIDDRDYDNEGSLARDISRLAKAFIKAKKKVAVYGISTNSNITNQDAINDYKYLINNATYFSVRDEYSREELAKIADKQKIHLVDDLVFADDIFAKTRPADNSGSRITIIPIFDKDTLPGLEALLKGIVATTKDDIRIVSFYDEEYHEIRTLETILDTMGYDRYRVKEIIIPRTASELRDALGDSKLIISMRYHGTLFASALGKRVLRLDHDKHPHYQFKNKYLATEYGFGVDNLLVSEVKGMDHGAIKAVLDTVGVREKVIPRVRYMQASKNLDKVIRML